jgi:biotin carboxyl carrier protein
LSKFNAIAIITQNLSYFRISRYGNAPMTAAPVQVATPAPAAVAPVVSVETTENTVIDGHPITSPMVGTFYSAIIKVCPNSTPSPSLHKISVTVPD